MESVLVLIAWVLPTPIVLTTNIDSFVGKTKRIFVIFSLSYNVAFLSYLKSDGFLYDD